MASWAAVLVVTLVGATSSWRPVYDNTGAMICTVGGNLRGPSDPVNSTCVGPALTVVPPPCDLKLHRDRTDCYNECVERPAVFCKTYFDCPPGFMKSEMIWTCENTGGKYISYDMWKNVQILENRSYRLVEVSKSTDDGRTWTPHCSMYPEHEAYGYQTCYTEDPNVGVPTSTTTTTTTTLGGVWEQVGEPGRSACRGRNVNDNSDSHYTIHSASSLGECQVLCTHQPGCKGIEYSLGRCEIWTRPQGIYISKELEGFTCLRLGRATATMVPLGTDRACRHRSPTDNSPSYYTVSSPPCMLLSDCKARCAAADVCYGIEFSLGRCEIWHESILAVANVAGFECWNYESAETRSVPTFESNMLLP